jgi:hypothetical protein
LAFSKRTDIHHSIRRPKQVQSTTAVTVPISRLLSPKNQAMLDGMKTVIYARVSTSEQSCEMQLRELRDYAARRGLKIIGEFVDTGWSGAKASRPELDRLMREARLRRFDVVLV